MIGAIIGDLAGSIYEFEQTRKVKNVEVKELISDISFYSDDTILTVAIIDAILQGGDYNRYLREYANRYLGYLPNFSPYFKGIFSKGFTSWLKTSSQGKSCGNGAMMRISPVGFMFETEEDVIDNAILATICSQNNTSAISSSIKVALIIFYARKGLTKEQILKKLNITLKFKPFERFNITCIETFDNCVYATFTSNSFEEAVKKVISYGGDTDTNACIVGAMSEALYSVNRSTVALARQKLPKEFLDVLGRVYEKENIV